MCFLFFFSSRRRHTRWSGDWSSDVCSSDLASILAALDAKGGWWMVEASMSAANIGDTYTSLLCGCLWVQTRLSCKNEKSSATQRHVCLFSLTNNSKILLILHDIYFICRVEYFALRYLVVSDYLLLSQVCSIIHTVVKSTSCNQHKINTYMHLYAALLHNIPFLSAYAYCICFMHLHVQSAKMGLK